MVGWSGDLIEQDIHDMLPPCTPSVHVFLHAHTFLLLILAFFFLPAGYLSASWQQLTLTFCPVNSLHAAVHHHSASLFLLVAL